MVWCEHGAASGADASADDAHADDGVGKVGARSGIACSEHTEAPGAQINGMNSPCPAAVADEG
eukprot:8019838-Alexandrium_andersonii.AAC.1